MKKCLVAFLTILPLCAQTARGSRHLLGLNQPLTAPSGRSARAIAQDFIHAQAAAELSLTEADLAGLYVAKEYQTAHNGVTHLIYKQQFSGVDVYNAEWVVNVASDGSILNAGGRIFAAPPPDVVLPDATSALRAARASVRAVSRKAAENYFPMIAGTTARPNGIRLAGGDLPDDIDGQLVWYGGSAGVKPAWVFYVTDMDGVNRYATVIDDASQSLMSKTALTFFQSPSAPKGQIFERESPQPSPTPAFF
jgi:hypothetical protein